MREIICFKSLSAASCLALALLTSMVISSTEAPCLKRRVRQHILGTKTEARTSFLAPSKPSGQIQGCAAHHLVSCPSRPSRNTLLPSSSNSSEHGEPNLPHETKRHTSNSSCRTFATSFCWLRASVSSSNFFWKWLTEFCAMDLPAAASSTCFWLVQYWDDVHTRSILTRISSILESYSASCVLIPFTFVIKPFCSSSIPAWLSREPLNCASTVSFSPSASCIGICQKFEGMNR